MSETKDTANAPTTPEVEALAAPLAAQDSGDGAPPDNGGDHEPPQYVHPHQVSIEDEMRSSYVDYAMSVIVGRALPDVRDGLKPVHRRVLFTQHMMRNNWNAAYKKSARIVGDCIGKYHPHGDTAVYDTLVRMAQDFSMRLPLVDGQGNFGSIDGDPPAAMRYTEVRMTRAAQELLADLDKETVDFQDNYDGHDQEPTVLPARIPNLLVNGSGGIAVGMATNIPPHNLSEVIDATVALIDDPGLGVLALMQHVVGPDFPTGGTIYGHEGIYDAYTTGRGKLKVRGKTHFEEKKGTHREVIIIDELPYQVNKARLIEHIAQLVRDKKIEGISDLRDESDRHGIRVVIECKRDAIAQVVLNHLYRLTNLQTTFGVINLAIVGGQPLVLTLKEMINHFIDHRREVVTRRCLYELEQAEARAHILQGLLIALDAIDEVITLIRASADAPAAKAALMDRFALSDRQSQAILDMRLQRLTGLERDKIQSEFDELQRTIAWLKEVLADDGLLMGIIKEELRAIQADYATPRRTDIVQDEGSIRMEDLIADEDMVVTISGDGYVKRTPVSAYRAQRRGGRGKTGMATKAEDVVSDLFVSSAHQPILFFTSKGRAFALKTYELPEGSAATRGKPIINVLDVEKDEEVKAVLPVSTFDDPEAYVLLATRKGKVKKTALAAYSKIRATGIIGIRLGEDDDLIDARLVYPWSSVMLATRNGQAIRFASQTKMVWRDPSEDGEDAEGRWEKKEGVRPMGRVAAGVRGIRLVGDDEVVSMAVLTTDEPPQWYVEWRDRNEEARAALRTEEGAEPEDAEAAGDEDGADEDAVEVEEDGVNIVEGHDDLPPVDMLTITEKGYGKRTGPAEYRLISRGGKGVRNLNITGKNGRVVGLRTTSEDNHLIMVTDGGKLIRTAVEQIRLVGRVSQGVKVINLEAGEKVVGFDVLVEDDSDEHNTEGLQANGDHDGDLNMGRDERADGGGLDHDETDEGATTPDVGPGTDDTEGDD